VATASETSHGGPAKVPNATSSHSRLLAQKLEDHHETLQLINNELSARIDRQHDIGAKVDNKAIFLAGFAAAAAQFLATRPHVPVSLLSAALAAYGLSFAFAVSSISLSKFQDLAPRQFFDRYGLKSTGEVLGRLCAHKVGSYELNAQRYQRKARLWWLSLTSLTVGVFMSIIALLEGGHYG
jgi:hypothetical protein